MFQQGDIIGRYEVIGTIGDGGMATVYRVRDTVLRSEHALKVLSPELANDAGLRERFLTEGQALAQFDHPNIVRVTNVVVEPGVAGLVQELLQGETLEDLIEREGALPGDRIRRIFGPVLSAVGYVHSKGVIHRDLKPSNIFLHADAGLERPVVLDFGIARVGADGGIRHGTKRKTRTGTTLGTSHYMSPEQVRATEDLDQRSDVFALGAVLYELATGQVAFDGASEYEVMQSIVEGRVANPALLASVEPGLASVIATALDTDASARFAACEDMAAALRGSGVGGRTSVQRRSSENRSLRSRLVPALVFGTTLAFILCAAGFAVVFTRNGGTAAPQAMVQTPTPQTAPTPTPSPAPAPTPDPAVEEQRIQRQVQQALSRRQAELDQQAADLAEREAALARRPEPLPPPVLPVRVLRPTGITASSVYSSPNARRLSYDASVAADGDGATWWSEGVDGDGIGQWLRVSTGPAEIHRVRLIPGYDKVKSDSYGDRWTLNNRLASVTVSLSDGTSFNATLPDTRGWHTIELPKPIQASWVKVTILSVHPGYNSKGVRVRDSGIAEIEVWGR